MSAGVHSVRACVCSSTDQLKIQQSEGVMVALGRTFASLYACMA